MKRASILLALSVALTIGYVARAEDDKKPPASKAPDPSKALPAGEALAAGTVKRERLYPLDEGRTWRYELKTWLSTQSGEDGAATEESEPPRTHRLDVATGATTKIDGKDARALEWRLDDADAQKAYYIEDAGSILCVQRRLGAGEHAHEYAFTPPQPVLKGDLVIGGKWTWEGTAGPAKGKQTFEVIREEKIKAAGKELPCLVVRMSYTGEDESSGTSVKWYSPDVGLVREESEVKADQQIYRTLAVLTRYETKK